MPITPIVLQRRLAEVGRIRIGVVVPTSNGKTRPSKIDTLRFTSASKPLIEKVAAAYGGDVKAWTPANGGASQWEVVTTSNRVPVVVPPQSVTQWMETWSGGGCQRRCDGERETITDSPCLCAQQDNMTCRPTTRLSVMLRDIEGIGVWRLESHGWNAAAELPGTAEFLAQAGGYIPAHLYLKAVRQVTDGKTKDFMVPALEVEGWTPGQAIAGSMPLTALGGAAPAIAAAQLTDELTDALADCHTAEDVRALWKKLADAKQMNETLAGLLTARAEELKGETVEATIEPDDDTAWAALVTEAGLHDLTMTDLEKELRQRYGDVELGAVQYVEMAHFLKTGEVAA